MPQVNMSFHAESKPLIRVCQPVNDPFCETVVIKTERCTFRPSPFEVIVCKKPNLTVNKKL